jgi:hypothetical protein
MVTFPPEENMPILLGFNHQFQSIHQEGSHDVTEGFRKSTTFDPFSIMFMLPNLIPLARKIVCRHLSIERTYFLIHP